MNIHFIAIGGAVMHNLAIALHNKGYAITGSDDEIFEPSRSRLREHGLLPETEGWEPDRITPGLDGVILGMHARKENPELIKARELGLKIWSFPEYIYEHSKNKRRVVVGGSHGKTTITSMIMHVLRHNNMEFDYLVGSQLEGFDTMVRLSDEADVMIIEGDEYLTSALDPRPKFLWYKPHIALITGIAWDHMNVFPTYGNYMEQFRKFIDCIEPDGMLFWFDGDPELKKMTEKLTITNESYAAHPYLPNEDGTYLDTGDRPVIVPFFGKHNMQNISGALHICLELGVTTDQFYDAIVSFRGAARRQQLLAESDGKRVYLDFAHAPSKLRATVSGFREAFPDTEIIACFELHTFSSLNHDFLPQYKNTLRDASTAIVFFNPEVLKLKQLPPIDPGFVKQCFARDDLEVIHDANALKNRLLHIPQDKFILLMMSSGSFSGMELKKMAGEIVKNR